MRCVLVGSVCVALLACISFVQGEEVEWHAAKTVATPPAAAPLQPASLQQAESPEPSITNPLLPKTSPVTMTAIEPAGRTPATRTGDDESSRHGFRAVTFRWPENPMKLQPQPQPEPIGPPRKIESTPSKPAPFSPGSAWRGPLDKDYMHPSPLVCDSQVFNEEPNERATRFYFEGEYLLWFTKLMKAPALVTTAPPPTTSPPPSFGFLGQPGTTILYGGGAIGDSFHQGARFTTGVWLDDCQTCGVEARYFFLGESIQRFHADSNAFAILTRPFFRQNPPNPQESGQIVSFPPGFTFGNETAIPDVQGAIDIQTLTSLWGIEFNAKECLCRCGARCGGYRVDLFAGFRYLDLQDRLAIQENLLVGQNDPVVAPGTTAVVNDKFSSHNQFYGGQVGFRSEYHYDNLFAELRGSVAIGGTAQTLVVDGSQFVTPPGQPTQIFPGGLLAVSSNIGRHTRGAFSVVPEITLNAGYQVTPGLRFFVGYDFLLWTRVMRASEQIDRSIDVNLVPNLVPPGVFGPVFPERPAVFLRQNDFWAQGVQVGLQARW